MTPSSASSVREQTTLVWPTRNSPRTKPRDDPEEDPESEYGDFFVGGKLRFHLAHIDIPKWRHLLEQDRTTLRQMLVAATEVGPERDAKLAELRRRIEQKLLTPSTRTDGRPNRKVLVFTAFSDTAEYLYENLAPAVHTAGGQIGLVQGSGGNRTTFGRSNYDEILANFSPGSHPGSLTEDGIDVLVATDCISEGQNLQDCDIVINYDIHWNPVRIIQRFGRVDRIGSPNDSVKLVNFWPVEDLDRYLNVQNRVHARMALVDVTAAQGDNLLEDKDTKEIVLQELQFRDDQLRQLREQVVDLEDLEDSVSLADFSLADFRRDLQELLASRRGRVRKLPRWGSTRSCRPAPQTGSWRQESSSACASEAPDKLRSPPPRATGAGAPNSGGSTPWAATTSSTSAMTARSSSASLQPGRR